MLNLTCVICAEFITPSDSVDVTTCGHMFHVHCLQQWLERSKTCPQCRHKCNDRSIFRVYFNVANLDTSRVDVGALHEQLDNANLQLKVKDKELHQAEATIKALKDTQKKCLKTITGLEQKMQKNEFVIQSYSEQVKLLKMDAKLVDDLRKEANALRHELELQEGATAIVQATKAEAEKLLKNENDSAKLAVWIATLKRELRLCENKKTDIRNVLKVVQSDLRKEINSKKSLEIRISQLESENYQLTEKMTALEESLHKPKPCTSNSSSPLCPNAHIDLNTNILAQVLREEKRASYSPTIKDNVRSIEQSTSPYLNIKSSSVGLVPMFKRQTNLRLDAQLGVKATTTKMATLRVSPAKLNQTGDTSSGTSAGAVRKTSSDLSEKYSIFKRPRLTLGGVMVTATKSANSEAPKSNYVSNGFGGSQKRDPFVEREAEAETSIAEGGPSRGTQNLTVPGAAVPPTSFRERLKVGGLRNFKLPKKA